MTVEHKKIRRGAIAVALGVLITAHAVQAQRDETGANGGSRPSPAPATVNGVPRSGGVRFTPAPPTPRATPERRSDSTPSTPRAAAPFAAEPDTHTSGTRVERPNEQRPIRQSSPGGELRGERDHHPRSPFDATPSTYAPRYHEPARPTYPSGSVYVYPYGTLGTYWYAPSQADVPAAQARDVAPAVAAQTGTLLLDVEPPATRVYVDGVYVGLASDFARTGLRLSPGTHEIALVADGFQPRTETITIAANRLSTYTTRLNALTAPPSASAVPAPRAQDPLYVIPGCYAGNRPPASATLPSGCDASRVRRF